jgi:putative membrane protein
MTQPGINALLNSISMLLLLFGFMSIKGKNAPRHKRFMLAATVTSALFLISYLIYHHRVGSVPFPYHDWTRPLYFFILMPHIVLAAVMTPLILLALWFAFKKKFASHKKLVVWLWPIWIFVSLSGVLVYLMLYQL